MLQLRRVAHTAPLDFSKVYAILKWFSTVLDDASSTFSAVSARISRLNDMVSLTSGHGLVELWELLYDNTPKGLVADLLAFSHLSNRLKDDPDSQGMLH